MIRSKQFVILEIGRREKDIRFKRKFIDEVHQVLERLLSEVRESNEFEFKAEALLDIAWGLEHLLGEAFANSLANIRKEDEQGHSQQELESFSKDLHALFEKHFHAATQGISDNN